MAVAQSFSKDVGLGVPGAKTWIKRMSASSEMFTRVEDGWRSVGVGCCGEYVVDMICSVYDVGCWCISLLLYISS